MVGSVIGFGERFAATNRGRGASPASAAPVPGPYRDGAFAVEAALDDRHAFSPVVTTREAERVARSITG